MFHALDTGLVAGFLVAAQVGPIWLLCVRSVLGHGRMVGIAIGAGAALVDMLYAGLGMLGAVSLLQITALRLILTLAGAAMLLVLGARTLRAAFAVRAGLESAEEVASPRRAFFTGLAATASNPMTIASWAAVVSAANTLSAGSRVGTAALNVAGVGLGTLLWFVVLSGAVGALRKSVGRKFATAVDLVSGSGLILFGGLLGWHAVRAEA